VDTFYLMPSPIGGTSGTDAWVTFSRALRNVRLYTVDEVLAEFSPSPVPWKAHIRTQARERYAMPKRPAVDRAPAVPHVAPRRLDPLRIPAPTKYSLTDCVSMQAMRREGLTDVLSNDHHSRKKAFTSYSHDPQTWVSHLLRVLGLAWRPGPCKNHCHKIPYG